MMNDLILKNKKNRLCLFRLLFLFLLFPVSNVRAGAPAYVGDVYITAPPDESTATLPTATIQAKAYETENELTEVRIGIDDVACTNMGLMTRVSGGGGSAADPGVFEYTWNTESCTNGSHNICAQAYDAADAKYKISGTSVVYCYTPPDFTLSPGDIIFNPLSAGFNESIQISATVYKTGGPTIAGGVTVGTPDGGVGNTDAYFTMLDLLKPIDADGVITEWKVWFTDINSQARLRIFRDDGTNYVFVGESQLETPVPDVVNTYATSIAVQAGDKVGLYWTQGYVYIGYYTAASGIMYINADQTGTSLKTAWTAYAAQLDLEVSGVTYTAGTVKFYDSDPDSGGVQIGATQDINILNDDSQTVSIDWSTDTEKYHDIYVYVDREDLVDESNETNNKAFNAVLVSSAPDAVKDLTAGASTTLSINLDWHATGDDGYTGVLNNSTFTVQYTSVTAWAEGNSWSTNTATVPGYVYTTEIATTGVTAGSQRFYTQTVEVGMSNTIYYFRLWTKDDVGTYSGLSNGATASTLAEPVISTQIYSVFYTSVTLNWLPHPLSPSSATCEGYKLQASTAPDFTGVVYSSVTSSVNVSTLTLEALGTNTTYYFRAGSLNWYEEPNYILAGSTCTLKPPPGASPFDPEISAVFMSSMTMTWTSASSDDGYLVQASTALDFTGTISSSETADGTLETLTVSEPSLDSNTTYYLRVGALWGETTSYAATQAASTLANPLASAQYQGVFITSAAVSWPALPASPPDASSKTCEGYQAQASTASNFTGAVFSSSTLSAVLSTLTVSGLSPNTTYYFRAGPLNWQSVANYLILTATPTLVSPPGQALPTALSVSSYSITAQWTAGDPENPSGTNYTLEMSSTDFEAGTEIFSQDTTDLQAEVSGLMANTTYYIRPKAVNWALIESYGVTAATSTLTRLVEGATYYSVAITSVVVNWLELPAEPSSATCRGYIVEASTASDFTGEILSSSTINGVAPSTLTVKNLYSETEYYFRAGAYNWNFVPNYVLLGSTETKTA
ncbi:MAG: hypothetical protein KKH28_12730, partial [Elusimicrobia bacterium]|nr:hypothetical protein [Elusimicrobiota bacterium]